MVPEEVGLVHAPSGVQLGASQRLADGAFASWRCGTAPSMSLTLTSTLSLSTRSSDVEFLVQRGIYAYPACVLVVWCIYGLLVYVRPLFRAPSPSEFAQSSCSGRSRGNHAYHEGSYTHVL